MGLQQSDFTGIRDQLGHLGFQSASPILRYGLSCANPRMACFSQPLCDLEPFALLGLEA